MKFVLEETSSMEFTQLLYSEEDDYFFYSPNLKHGYTSVLVNDLELGIDHQGRIGYVSGYCPLIKYQETDQFPHDYSSHRLIAILNTPPIPGVCMRLNDSESWSVYINKKQGWVCIGSPDMASKRLIEFAPDCIAALDGQELTAVWLHPRVIKHSNGSGLTN